MAFPNAGSIGDKFPGLVPSVAGVRVDEIVASVGMLAFIGSGEGLARRRAG